MNPKEVDHNKSAAYENKNEGNSNMSLEFFKDDAKETTDDDNTIERKGRCNVCCWWVKASWNVEDSVSKIESVASTYNILDDLSKAAVKAALNDVLYQHSSNEGSENEVEDDGLPFAESIVIEVVG
jgi:hypothetical protein